MSTANTIYAADEKVRDEALAANLDDLLSIVWLFPGLQESVHPVWYATPITTVFILMTTDDRRCIGGDKPEQEVLAGLRYKTSTELHRPMLTLERGALYRVPDSGVTILPVTFTIGDTSEWVAPQVRGWAGSLVEIGYTTHSLLF